MDGWTRLGSMDTMGSVSAGLFKIVVKGGVTSILLGNSKNFLLFYALEPPCYFKTQYAELHPNENFTNPRSWYVMVTLMKFCLFRSVSTTEKKKLVIMAKNIIISFSLAIRCVLNFPWIFQTSGRSFSDLFFELLPLLFLILLQFNIAISSTSSDLELLILSSASFLLHCRVSFWHWRLSAGIHFPSPLMKVLVFMSPSLSTTTVL